MFLTVWGFNPRATTLLPKMFSGKMSFGEDVLDMKSGALGQKVTDYPTVMLMSKILDPIDEYLILAPGRD